MFHRRDPVGNVEYEIGANESVSTAVVRAVSAVGGRKPTALRPLTEVLEPEALDVLFDPRPGGRPRTGGRLSFVYGDCRVTVDNGEYLTVRLLGPSGRVQPSADDPAASPASENRGSGREGGDTVRRD